MDRSEQEEDENPDRLHGDSAAVNSSDFFLGLRLRGKWKRCPSSGAPLLVPIWELPLDKEGEEIDWLPLLIEWVAVETSARQPAGANLCPFNGNLSFVSACPLPSLIFSLSDTT